MERKIQKSFLYEGFGFPIELKNVPMIKIRGIWTPEIDYNKLELIMIKAIALKPSCLSGNEIKFIRKFFKMTLQSFGNEFGVSHVAVMDWEAQENYQAKINPATEKCIRLFVLDELKIKDKNFRESYHSVNISSFAKQQKTKQRIRRVPLRFDFKKNELSNHLSTAALCK